MMVWKLTLTLGALLALAVLALTLAQGALIFPRALVGPAPALPKDVQALLLDTPDGEVLHGVAIAGARPDLPVLLGFGGNAWSAAALALYLHQIAPDHTVVAYHYRGYAPSTGRPSARALMDDAMLVHDAIDAPHGVIAVGFSLGSAVAATLASARPLRGVVLVTPFDSLRAVAQDTLGGLPLGPLFRHQIDAAGALAGSAVPVQIILAMRDEVIAPARADALIQRLEQGGHAPQVARIDAGHNDIYNRADAQTALRAALARLRTLPLAPQSP
jgi:uncharacterized protein